ncbi:hypothetical protein BLNAU_18599 [Blattamonas nauphoetae]|uniref:Uncharacterized protein n=1 Tax=Blattamonas nauphoetae TaxID=2049346 RepID=A0ABQ9X595_9EUKA|nr:hypothetical protein BLNAU_18599 [Blattamonas nauphoetae]
MEFDLRRKKSRFSFVEWAKQDDENEDAKTEAVEKEAEEKGEEMDGRQNPPSAPASPTITLLPINFKARPSSREQEATGRAASAERESEHPKQESTSSLTLAPSITAPDTLLTRSVKPKRRKEFTRMTRKKVTGLMEEGSVEVQKRRMMNTGRGSAGSARPRTPRIAELEKEGRKGASPEGEEKAEVKENKLVEPVQTSRLVDVNVWVRKKEGTLKSVMDEERQRWVRDLRWEMEMPERRGLLWRGRESR